MTSLFLTPHGYPVLRRKTEEAGRSDIIVAYRQGHPVHQYVVWRQYADGSCEGGGYYATEKDAFADYARRG